MSLGQRLTALFKGRSQDDPRDDLDASYERQLALLQRTRRGAADVATSRKRLELQLRQLESRADELHAQAVAAVAAGQDERARELLVQRAALVRQVDDLAPQEAQVRAQEEQLQVQVARLAAKVEAFRSQKEALAAGYTAAEARGEVASALSGVGEELGSVDFAVQRARDRTEQMQAQAGALEELAALQTDALSPGAAAQRRLEELSGSGSVDDELARLKDVRALPGPPPAASPRAAGRKAQEKS